MQFGSNSVTASGKTVTFKLGTDPAITLNDTQGFNPQGTGNFFNRIIYNA